MTDSEKLSLLSALARALLPFTHQIVHGEPAGEISVRNAVIGWFDENKISATQMHQLANLKFRCEFVPNGGAGRWLYYETDSITEVTLWARKLDRFDTTEIVLACSSLEGGTFTGEKGRLHITVG